MTFSHIKDLVIIIPSMSGGGAERVTANLANHWAVKGWGVTVVTVASRSLDFYELDRAVNRIALDLAGDSVNVVAGLWQNLRRVMALRRVLRKIQPDLALGVMSTANVLLALAVWRLPKVRAIGSEHVYPPKLPLGAIWEGLRRRTYSRLAAVTATTSEIADWLKAHTGTRLAPVIPNAAPWPLLVQEPKVLPESVCPSGRQLLLAVGRLEPQKGFDWLIESFSVLAKKYSTWDLVILGEGYLRAMLKDQVRAAKLENRVFLPGRVGNVGEWYHRADLYVMSSRFEGFGNTLAEALAYGLPAVSFDCDTGPRDIIRHEMDGLLVPPGDVPRLTDALDRLMGNADLRERFAERAVDARERFSMERIAGMWEELFEEAVK